MGKCPPILPFHTPATPALPFCVLIPGVGMRRESIDWYNSARTSNHRIIR
jgi:hypothetical protein